MIKMKKIVTMKVDGDWKKTIKGLSAEMDTSMITLTKNLSKYRKEIEELLKRN